MIADIARVLLVVLLWGAGMFVGLRGSFGYGGGWVGLAPALVAFFAGPWAAAWVSCRILPSRTPRIVLRLSAGVFVGFLLWLVFAAALDAITRQWPAGDPRARFTAQHDFALTIVPLLICLTAGGLGFSRARKESLQDY